MNAAVNCITAQISDCKEIYSEPANIQNLANSELDPERSSLRRRDENVNANSEETFLCVSRLTNSPFTRAIFTVILAVISCAILR